MLALRVIVGLGLAYIVLLLLAWLFQERLAFPAPRARLPDPKRVGVENGEKVELVSGDGTNLVGWYLKPVDLPQPAPASSTRSEEHTSELLSQFHLVCRLLLEKKKKKHIQ